MNRRTLKSEETDVERRVDELDTLERRRAEEVPINPLLLKFLT